MEFVNENVKHRWDTEAEYHRGQRDRFAGQYDPPAQVAALSGTSDDSFDAAREAYESGYRQGEITP